MRWDFSATKGLLHFFAQREIMAQEQQAQREFELRKQREKLMFDQQAEEELRQRKAQSFQNLEREDAPRWPGVPFPTTETVPGKVSPETLSDAVSLGTLDPYMKWKKAQTPETMQGLTPYQIESLKLRKQEIEQGHERIGERDKEKKLLSKKEVEKEINALTKQAYSIGNKIRSFDLEFFTDETKVNSNGEFANENTQKLYSTTKQSYMDELASIESEIQRLNESIGGTWKKSNTPSPKRNQQTDNDPLKIR